MMSLITELVPCPACREERAQSRWIQYPIPLATRTDFHERYAGPSRLLHECLLCTGCGFAARDIEWNGEGIAEYLANGIRERYEPTQFLLPSGVAEIFERAAECAEFMNRPKRYEADLWLKAAWGCVEEDDTEAERYFRRKAVWAFETAMDGYGGVIPEEAALIAYLCGELHRRIGDRIRAHDWFVHVDSQVLNDNDRYLIALAAQQDEAPLEWMAR